MTFLLVTALVLTAIAAYVDHRTGLIPNVLTVGGFVVALLAHVVLALAAGGLRAVPAALGTSIGGALLAAIVPLFLFRANALGGGDVKLFIALGALLGPLVGLRVELLSFACSALLVPLKLAWEGELLGALGRSALLFANLVLPASRKFAVDRKKLTWVRLGPAIFAGTAWAVATGLH